MYKKMQFMFNVSDITFIEMLYDFSILRLVMLSVIVVK